MKRLIPVLLLCLNVAHAEFKDGNKLLADLNGDVYERLHGLGYIVGVSDMGWGVVHCAPGSVTAGQLKDMVKNYLENVPAERHQTGDILVNRVLKATWPCQKRGTAL